jgi:catalase (peroxidase I)
MHLRLCPGVLLTTFFSAMTVHLTAGRCPFSDANTLQIAANSVTKPSIAYADDSKSSCTPTIPEIQRRALPPLTQEDYKAIKADIAKALVTSDDHWPADFGHYGGLAIRMAWHCSGTYRKFDGRGGCDGGRIRFLPEIGWDDNANVDKMLYVLEPIHTKWEKVISW